MIRTWDHVGRRRCSDKDLNMVFLFNFSITFSDGLVTAITKRLKVVNGARKVNYHISRKDRK